LLEPIVQALDVLQVTTRFVRPTLQKLKINSMHYWWASLNDLDVYLMIVNYSKQQFCHPKFKLSWTENPEAKIRCFPRKQ